MENEKTNSNMKGIFITAIICILLCIPLGIFIGNKLFNSPNSTSQNIENLQEKQDELKESKEENVEKEVTDQTIIDKLESITNKMATLSLQGITWDLYRNLSLTDSDKTYIILSKMPNSEFIQLSGEEYEESCVHSYISADAVQKEFSKWFKGTISTFEETEFNAFPYNYQDGKYYNGGCGGWTADDVIIAYNQKYTHKDNIYFVYQYIGVMDPVGAVYDSIEYTNHLMDNKDHSQNILDNANPYNIINESNYNKFSEYKLTFSLENNNLIFKSIDKL